MALSGSRDFGLDRDSIINAALRKIGVLAYSQTANNNQINKASETLNVMVKALQHSNVFLWETVWETKTLTASSEVTGSDGNIYTCILSHTSSATDKPITGADWRKYWILRGSTGGTWVTSTSYSSVGDFELSTDIIGLEKAFLRDTDGDQPIELIGKNKYYDIKNKGDEGTPVSLYFENTLTPKCYLYRQPDTVSPDWVIHLLKVKKLQDFDSATNDPDFKSRCLKYLIYGLAYELGFEYSAVNENKMMLIKQEAEIAKRDIIASNSDVSENNFCDSAF